MALLAKDLLTCNISAVVAAAAAATALRVRWGGCSVAARGARSGASEGTRKPLQTTRRWRMGRSVPALKAMRCGWVCLWLQRCVTCASWQLFLCGQRASLQKSMQSRIFSPYLLLEHCKRVAIMLRLQSHARPSAAAACVRQG